MITAQGSLLHGVFIPLFHCSVGPFLGSLVPLALFSFSFWVPILNFLVPFACASSE